jgi:hypothetical protein
MSEIAASGIDLILTGHFHQAFTHAAAAPYRMTARRSVLVSQAGTAVSTRLREEVNSYNFLRIDGADVTCQQRDWTGRSFVLAAERHYRHAAGHWSEIG